MLHLSGKRRFQLGGTLGVLLAYKKLLIILDDPLLELPLQLNWQAYSKKVNKSFTRFFQHWQTTILFWQNCTIVPEWPQRDLVMFSQRTLIALGCPAISYSNYNELKLIWSLIPLILSTVSIRSQWQPSHYTTMFRIWQN